MRSCNLFFADIIAIQSKIEPAMISFFTSFKMATQKTILSQKKAANLSLFSISSKWITSGQNAGNSWENLGNVFFFCLSQTQVVQWMSFCIVLVVCEIF